MTVAELIAELQKQPQTLKVFFEDGEYGPCEVDSLTVVIPAQTSTPLFYEEMGDAGLLLR